MAVPSKRLANLYEKFFSCCSDRAVTQREFMAMVVVTLDVIQIPEKISITLKNIDCGRGYYFEKKIFLPNWIGKYHVVFQIYYMIHELSHCIAGTSHSSLFIVTEDHLLALWGIKIIRKRVYPEIIYFNGAEVLNVPNSMKTVQKESKSAIAQAS